MVLLTGSFVKTVWILKEHVAHKKNCALKKKFILSLSKAKAFLH